MIHYDANAALCVWEGTQPIHLGLRTAASNALTDQSNGAGVGVMDQAC